MISTMIQMPFCEMLKKNPRKTKQKHNIKLKTLLTIKTNTLNKKDIIY